MKLLLSLLTFFSFALFSQSIDLSMRLEKNKDYTFYTRSNIEVFEKKKGKVSKTKLNMNIIVNFHVTKVKNDILFCELHYDYFEMNFETKDKNFSIATDRTFSDDDYTPEGIIGRVFSEMTKHNFYLEIDHKGKILDCTGFEKLFAGAIDGITKLPKDVRENLKEDIQKKYGKESFATNFELLTQVYPKETVATNDTWENTNVINSAEIQLNALNHFTLTEIQQDYVLIEDKIDYSPILGLEKSAAKKEGQGTGTAFYKLNKKTGWIYEGKINQSIKLYDDFKNDPENYLLLLSETTYSDH